MKDESKASKPMMATDLTKAAKEAAPLAIKTLMTLMRGKSQASVKLAAAREMLDRGFGKPKPPKPTKARAPKPKDSGLTVIIKRPEDITPDEWADAAATERGEL